MKYVLALALLSATQLAHAGCSVSDIKITSLKAKFINTCGSADCTHMTGVATLVNSCAEATGVQIQITAYDKSDSPVSTSENWPASIRNIPPGSYTFSLDQWLDFDPAIASFGLKPIDVNQWEK